MTTADLIYAEGSASNNDPTKQALTLVKAFGGYGFNGDGHTMHLSVDIDCKKFALFYKIGTVSSTSAEKDDPHTRIHDLRLTGSIRSTYTTTAKDQGMLLAALACYNNGAEVCNITSDVAIVHERSDFGSESDTKLKQGIIAGITATDQFGSPSYGNVTVTGAISTRGGVQNIGGITGTLASNNDYGTFTYTACEHTGAITVTQFSGRHSDGYIGGLIGNSQKQQPRLTDCTNRGDLTIDLQGGAGSIQSCGGIIGSGYGTLTRCDNHGNITADEAALKADGKTIVTRRYGGLIGGQGNVSTKDQTEARHFLAELTDCTNYGNIKVSSSMVGGLIGFTEKNWQETGILRNCVNEGMVESLAPVLDMGGLIGRSSGASLYGCTNRGTIKGASSRWRGRSDRHDRLERRHANLRHRRLHERRRHPACGQQPRKNHHDRSGVGTDEHLFHDPGRLSHHRLYGGLPDRRRQRRHQSLLRLLQRRQDRQLHDGRSDPGKFAAPPVNRPLCFLRHKPQVRRA